MAGIDSVLAQMGYEPGGATKRSPFEQIVNGIQSFGQTMQEEQAKREKGKQNQFAMYKTLRDAGYTAQEAHEAALKGVLPNKPPSDKTDMKMKEFQVSLAKSGLKFDETGNITRDESLASLSEDKPLAERKFEAQQEKERRKQEEGLKISEQQSQFVRDSAQDMLNTIGEVEKGMNYFGLTGGLPSIPGSERKNWEVNINKLLSGKIIDLMTNMKQASKTGATGFGQLSEKELAVLQQASTALKRDLSSKDARRYLEGMKQNLQKILTPTKEQELGMKEQELGAREQALAQNAQAVDASAQEVARQKALLKLGRSGEPTKYNSYMQKYNKKLLQQ
jgi:hypothetical protein